MESAYIYFLKCVYILARERNEPNYLAAFWYCPKIYRARFPEVPRSQEVVNKSSNKIHQTWGPPFSRAL